MSSSPKFGTDEWLRHVRSTPPVRDPLGRSRPTCQFSPYSRHLERNVGIEGGNELTAFLLLEALQSCGLVAWFKEQPFEEDNRTPDFLFQWHTGMRYVAEVKSAKFITDEVKAYLEEMDALVKGVGMAYVVWTDREHLREPLWSNVRKIDKELKADHDEKETERLIALLQAGDTTLAQLAHEGVDPDTVLHAVAQGRASFDFTGRWNTKTVISEKPHEASFSKLLGARHDPEQWWNALSDL
jgi:hypothetical protein